MLNKLFKSVAYFSKKIFGKEDNLENDSDSPDKKIKKNENFSSTNEKYVDPMKEQPNSYQTIMNEEIRKAENLGKIGIDLFKLGKYEDSKPNLLNCCDILMKIRRITNSNALEEKINFYLLYAEECEKKIKEKFNITPLYTKNQQIPNECLKNNIQPHMDPNILAIIRDTIICNKPNINFKDISKIK